MKSDNLLHKRGFVKTQSLCTVLRVVVKFIPCGTLGLRLLGKSLSERILPMPKSPFLSAFFAPAEADDEDVDGVVGPTHSSSTLCTYFL